MTEVFRRFPLLVLAVFVSAASPAASDLDIAKAALRDGLWKTAVKHAGKSAAEDPSTREQARLVVLEAMARGGDASGIPARIVEWGNPEDDGFRYWMAWALEARQEYAQSALMLKAPFASPDYAPLAERLGAKLAVELGDRADAEARFAAMAAKASGSLKTSNAVEWARALDRFGDAKKALSVLKSEGALAAPGAEGDEARLLAAGMAMRLSDAAEAQALWTKLVEAGSNTTEGAFVEASARLSDAKAAAGATNEAVRIARAALARAERPDLKRQAGFALGFALLADPATRAEGVAAVKDGVRSDPGAPGSRDAQLRLADTLLELGDESAAAEYKVLLETYPDASQDFHVLEGRGSALLKLGRRTDAIGMFASAAKAATNALDRARCEFNQCDALLADGKAEEAALVYAGIAERYAGDPVAEKARFMQGRALGLCGKAADAADVYREIAKAGGAYAAEATLSCAAYDSESGRTDEALAAYTKLIKDPAVKPTVVVDATIGRGRTLYRAYRFTDARSDFDAAAKADPSRADSMRFLSALCEYGLGRDEEAKKLAEAVLADFPRSPLAPEIALWLAKFDFQHGEFAKALEGFERYSKTWPEARHAAEAYVWAARAASAAGDFARAVEATSAAVKAGASGNVLAECLLVQAEALIELARFDEAAVVLERVAPGEAETPYAIRAALLRADCLFALGADNEQRYEEALVAYREISRAASLSSGDRLSVSFKIGRTLEKMGRIDDAVDEYYANVVLAFREARAKGIWFDDRGRTFFARAAFALADHYEARGEFAQAKNILQLVATAGVPASEEASKRIGRIGGRRSIL